MFANNCEGRLPFGLSKEAHVKYISGMYQSMRIFFFLLRYEVLKISREIVSEAFGASLVNAADFRFSAFLHRDVTSSLESLFGRRIIPVTERELMFEFYGRAKFGCT